MSRIGKKPVSIPDKVKAHLEKGTAIHIEGPKGKLCFDIPALINVKIEDCSIVLTRQNDELATMALHGMARATVNNMVTGVSEGFSKVLDIVGVGYKAEAKGRELVFALGYSHPIVFPLPQGIDARVDKQTRVTVTGCDRQLVGETAARIRKLRLPEPYKGKGIRYADEVVKHKVGKAAAGATGAA